MSIDENGIARRDAEGNIGDELLQAIRNIKSGKTGLVSTVEIPPVAEARHKVGLSQRRFAELLGVSPRTLQEWEQGRRQPSGAAKSLILIAIRHPEILKEVLAA